MAQYQHYIPQLLLRNFSHPYQPPEEYRAKRKNHRRVEKGKYKGDKVLNVVDLTSDEPHLIEAPVSRWFGQEEMYSDVFDTMKGTKDVEQELSALESQTAVILQKVKKAHENGDAGVCFTRVERNKLRKFLFVMKYRGPGFFEKYFSKDPQAYASEDKHLLRDYMAKKGFITPRDVWLHNLRAILHVDMDADGKWMTRLPDLMFPADATMFIFHAQHSYITFCTPAEMDDEFILTDQCYNLFEGPTSNTFCAKTGDYIGNTYLCFHEFGPVSPRLMIILRSNTLPEALEDKDSKEARQRMLYAAAALFPEPENVKSILEDLPVARAMNSYSRVVNNRLEIAPGESGTPQFQDRFTFRFWPISTKHMNIINSIFLDNLLNCNSIVFGSRISFRRTLEAYMTTQAHGFKNIGVGEHGVKTTRLACLEKLAIVLKKLGVENVPIFFDETREGNKPVIHSLDDEWLKAFKIMFEGTEFFDSSENPFWQTR
ncbi:hypothetical protein VE00_10653 [Pseudogymnoascus sp. WSF 3629]|nr:hypothetical protein VE00_10653 [Pseudogymnoascus sp. WSF 3629]